MWHKMDKKTKCLIHEALDNVLQKQHTPIAMVYDILFKIATII